MAEPPNTTVLRGAPTEEQARAIEAAVVGLWREDQARAAGSGLDPWVAAGRAEAMAADPSIVRGDPRGWRLAGRLGR